MISLGAGHLTAKDYTGFRESLQGLVPGAELAKRPVTPPMGCARQAGAALTLFLGLTFFLLVFVFAALTYGDYIGGRDPSLVTGGLVATLLAYVLSIPLAVGFILLLRWPRWLLLFFVGAPLVAFAIFALLASGASRGGLAARMVPTATPRQARATATIAMRGLLTPTVPVVTPARPTPTPVPSLIPTPVPVAPLPPPQNIGPVDAGGNAQIEVINDAPYGLTLDFKGPGAKSVFIESCATCKVYSMVGPVFCPTEGRPRSTFRLPPGAYEVTVTADAPGVMRFVGQWTLEGNRRYGHCFYVICRYVYK